MFINEKKNAIELSKKEAKAAAKFGTTEYKQLQEARRDYPTKDVRKMLGDVQDLYQSCMKAHKFPEEKCCVNQCKMIEYQYRKAIHAPCK